MWQAGRVACLIEQVASGVNEVFNVRKYHACRRDTRFSPKKTAQLLLFDNGDVVRRPLSGRGARYCRLVLRKICELVAWSKTNRRLGVRRKIKHHGN